jgi:hypothetical protein
MASATLLCAGCGRRERSRGQRLQYKLNPYIQHELNRSLPVRGAGGEAEVSAHTTALTLLYYCFTTCVRGAGGEAEVRVHVAEWREEELVR